MKIVKYQWRPEADSEIYIEWKGTGWAIMRHGFALNKEGEWEYEPMPSSRTEDYYQRCRYQTPEDAVSHLEALNIDPYKR